jgi:hypothetical protein
LPHPNPGYATEQLDYRTNANIVAVRDISQCHVDVVDDIDICVSQNVDVNVA